MALLPSPFPPFTAGWDAWYISGMVRWLTMVAICLVSGACALGERPRTIPEAEGCPAILLVRSGGLGFESQGGVIAAVWPSGRIVRAETPALPWLRHIVGTLRANDLAELMALASADATWSQPTGEVVLDTADDILTLRRQSESRRWQETPGFTSNAVVQQFREKLLAAPIDGAIRLDAPMSDYGSCR